MNKQVKLSTPTVKNEKISVLSASVYIPFDEPKLVEFLPLPHIVVTLHLSDGSTFERGFDLITGCPLEKYVQMAIGIQNQYYASSDSSK